MKKVFKIKSNEILGIEVNTAFNQLIIKLKNNLKSEGILKILNQHKQIMNRDNEKSFKYICKIIGKGTIVVRGLGFKNALNSLNTSSYLDDNNYKLINEFINKEVLTEFNPNFF